MQEGFVLRTKRAVKKVAAVGTGALMLGATAMGALALDLKDYPSPFVAGGKYDDANVLVVGANAAASDTLGMVDIATNLQYESKDCKASSGSVSVAGGVTEDIPLGSNIAASNQLDTLLDQNDIDTLMDGSLTFQSKDYDYKEQVGFGLDTNNITLQTSLSSSDDDYQSDIAMEFERASFKYFFSFDEAINVTKSTSTNPLEIKFLGKTLKITSVDSGQTKFTAYVGGEYFMDVGDSVEVNGKKITLSNVGSGGAIIVDVDGVSETISASSTKTINGIEIVNDETFYEDTKNQRSATLVIGKDAQETYQDGDAYVGEDEDDPNWVWNIAGLGANSASSIIVNNSGWAESGPILGIENDFVYNDDSDNPPMVGECVEMPNSYVALCLDSLTVATDDYAEYVIEYDSSADLSKVNSTLTSHPTIYLHTTVNEGLVVKPNNLGNASIAKDSVKTDKIWLSLERDGIGSKVMVYYRDTGNNTESLAGWIATGEAITFANAINFAEVNFQDTKDTNIAFDISGDGGVANALNLSLDVLGDTTADLASGRDDIEINLKHGVDNTFAGFGPTADKEEADDLKWRGATTKTLGTKDEDHRSLYGIIIKDPKSTLSSDEVRLSIPGDQVQGNVVVKGTSATTSKAGETCTVADITPVTKLDSEVAGSESKYNLILVGGPCANSAVEAVSGLGVTCDGWDFAEGEAVIKLAQNGDKVAMLVAGTSALDTRRAAKVVANYADYSLSGTEKLVKGTTLSDITVE